MIIDQDPKGYYDKIVNEPNPEKKSFNLLLAILVVVLFSFGGTIWYFKDEQKDLRQENSNLRQDALKNNTLYKEGYIKGREEIDSLCQIRYDRLQSKYDNLQKDSNQELKDQIRDLKIETRKIKDQARQINRELDKKQ